MFHGFEPSTDKNTSIFIDIAQILSDHDKRKNILKGVDKEVSRKIVIHALAINSLIKNKITPKSFEDIEMILGENSLLQKNLKKAGFENIPIHEKSVDIFKSAKDFSFGHERLFVSSEIDDYMMKSSLSSDRIGEYKVKGKCDIVEYQDSIASRTALADAICKPNDRNIWAKNIRFIPSKYGIKFSNISIRRDAIWGTYIFYGIPLEIASAWNTKLGNFKPPEDFNGHCDPKGKFIEFHEDDARKWINSLENTNDELLKTYGYQRGWARWITEYFKNTRIASIDKSSFVAFHKDTRISIKNGKDIRIAIPSPWHDGDNGFIIGIMRRSGFDIQGKHGKYSVFNGEFKDIKNLHKILTDCDFKDLKFENEKNIWDLVDGFISKKEIINQYVKINDNSTAMSICRLTVNMNGVHCGRCSINFEGTDNVILKFPPPWEDGWKFVKEKAYSSGFSFDKESVSWKGDKRNLYNFKRTLTSSSKIQDLIECFKHPLVNQQDPRFNPQLNTVEKQRLAIIDIGKRKDPLPATVAKLDKNLPEGKKLLPYQLVGIEFIEACGGKALIGDEMGVGKTHQAIGYTLMDKDRFPVLVIAPGNARGAWQDEYLQWGKSLNITVSGIDSGLENLPNTDVIAISYDLVKDFRDKLTSIPFKTVILDEFHYIKNPDNQRTPPIYQLIDDLNPPSVIALTGTPMPNNSKELWSSFRLLRPDFFGGTSDDAKQRYYEKHCIVKYSEFTTPFGTVKRLPVFGNIDLPTLHSYMKNGIAFDPYTGSSASLPLMLRRLKNEVTDLPPKQQIIHHLPFNEDDLQKINDDLTKKLKNAQGIDEQLGIINGARTFIGEAKVEPAYQFMKSFINKDKPSDPIVIFVQHHKIKNLLLEKFKKEFRVASIDSSTDSQRRFKLKNQFQNGELDVIILTSAGKEALTLTRSNKMFIVERDFVPGSELQKEDRIHRVTQERPCTIYYLHIKDSLDDHIGLIVDKKKKNISAAIDGLDLPEKEIEKSLVSELISTIMQRNLSMIPK